MSDDAKEAMAPEAAVPQSAGALLRQAREAAGVDPAALASALKVSVKKIEALEADRHEQLPDVVFTRGLASGVCRVLKIDAAPVLALLPRTNKVRLEDFDDPGLNTPFRTPGDEAKTPLVDRLSRPMVMAALVILLGALVLIFFPSSRQREEIGAIVARPATTAPAVEAPASQPAAAGDAVPVASTAQPNAGQQAAQPAVAVAPPSKPAPAMPAVAVAVDKPAAAAPKVAAAPAPTTAASEPEVTVRKKLSSTGIVVFKASGESWVEVTDANGAIQVSRLMVSGETVGASGPLPLKVTIGNAAVTQVLVRGTPFALESSIRQGVARFEVQ